MKFPIKIKGDCGLRRKVTLTLLPDRLKQDDPEFYPLPFFVMLRELKEPRSVDVNRNRFSYAFGKFAVLRKTDVNLNNPNHNSGYVYVASVNLPGGRGRIGCTKFGKTTWAKIKRAIAEAK